jgi:hypothetical protein
MNYLQIIGNSIQILNTSIHLLSIYVQFLRNMPFNTLGTSPFLLMAALQFLGSGV